MFWKKLVTGNCYANGLITFRNSLEKSWMPCLHTVLGARIKHTRIRNSVDCNNKAIQDKALQIKDCIQNQEVVDMQDNVNCQVYHEIKTTQTRPDTVFIWIMKDLAIRMSHFASHKNKIFGSCNSGYFFPMEGNVIPKFLFHAMVRWKMSNPNSERDET